MGAISNYAKSAKGGTPQKQRSVGRTDEVKNNEGAYVFAVSDKSRLERFLILGTDGGTYYATERKITEQNIDFIVGMIKKDTVGVVDVLADVADNNRAAKNSPSLFVLALLYAHAEDKTYIRESGVFNKVVRTSTHLFEVTEYMKSIGGMGRAKRNALAAWYTDKAPGALAYQAVKYRARNGYTHRDVFRIAHPKGVDQNVGNFILGREQERPVGEYAVLDGFEKMQKAGSVKEVIALLNEYKSLPWETIPTQFLREADVWKTLFYNGSIGQTALIRNLKRFDEIGAFKDVKFAGDVAAALKDEERIRKGRVHPVQYANARGVYGKDTSGYGYGYYGYRETKPRRDANPKILGALEGGFYKSFANVEPSNARTLVAVDVSPSMNAAGPAGLVGLTAFEAAGLMAMVAVRTEPYVQVMAFNHQPVPLNISDRDSFETVLAKMQKAARGWGGTDVAAPIVKALNEGVDYDAFIIYTDNDTHSGSMKPHDALKAYNSKRGRNAKVAVVGFTATNFTVADPRMPDNMMDFVGFDSAAPSVMADFFRIKA